MKKVAVGVFAVMAACAITCKAGTVTWGSGDLTSYGFSGASAGWVVQLYDDVSQNGYGAGGTIGGDDQLVAGDSTVLVSGKAGVTWGSTFAAPAGIVNLSDHVYSVIYNNTSIGAATQYRVVDASPYVLPAADQDAIYTQTTVNNAWVPVPEPGTMALLGLGLVTLASRTIRKKK